MNKALAAVLALLAVGAVSSAFPSNPQKYDVELSLKEKKVSDLSSQGLTLAFHVDMANTLTAPLALVRYDYRVMIDEAEFLDLQMELDEPLRIEPRSRLLIALPVKITYEYLFRTAPAVQQRDQAVCTLTGGLTFQDERKKEKRVPLACSGDFPIFRGLDIRIQPIVAKDLTVGGADLIFKAALRNPNGFAIRIEKITHKLALVGVNVAAGIAAQGIALDGRGEKTFEIPLLLDFFEIGKIVYDGLEQPPVAVRFSGEAEIGTPWGNFKIPLDKSDKIAVQKLSS
jgi:LEA14-like dessication related protein